MFSFKNVKTVETFAQRIVKSSSGNKQHSKGKFCKGLDTENVVLLALLRRSETLLDRL